MTAHTVQLRGADINLAIEFAVVNIIDAQPQFPWPFVTAVIGDAAPGLKGIYSLVCGRIEFVIEELDEVLRGVVGIVPPSVVHTLGIAGPTFAGAGGDIGQDLLVVFDFMLLGAHIGPFVFLAGKQIEHVLGPEFGELEVIGGRTGGVGVAGHHNSFAGVFFQLAKQEGQGIQSAGFLLALLGRRIVIFGYRRTRRHHHGAVVVKEHVLHLQDVHVKALQHDFPQSVGYQLVALQQVAQNALGLRRVSHNQTDTAGLLVIAVP